MRHIALDTETTGLGATEHRIIEIAALDFDPLTGEPTGKHYHTFINPKRSIPVESTKVHGKTLADLENEPVFGDIADDFLAYIEGTHLVIHNAPFDVAFLNAELKRAKRKSLAESSEKVTDTLAMSRRYVKSKTHTLDALCDRYEVDRSKRVMHGAFIDCEMLSRIYPFLKKEADAARARINTILPFELEAPLADTLEGAAERYLALDSIISVLEAEQKRHRNQIEELTAGANVDGSFFEIEYSPRTTTKWEKVKAAHLAGVDLTPYQATSTALYIKAK